MYQHLMRKIINEKNCFFIKQQYHLSGMYLIVCKIPLFARRTRPMQPVGQARRATIGHLVYNVSYCTTLKISI